MTALRVAVGMALLAGCASADHPGAPASPRMSASPEAPLPMLSRRPADSPRTIKGRDGEAWMDIASRHAESPTAVVLRSPNDIAALEERLSGFSPGEQTRDEYGIRSWFPVELVYFEEEMAIGVLSGWTGSGSNPVGIDAVVPDGDTLRVYASEFVECVTSGVIESQMPYVVVPRDPRPVVLMPMRRVQRGLYLSLEPDGTRRSSPCA